MIRYDRYEWKHKASINISAPPYIERHSFPVQLTFRYLIENISDSARSSLSYLSQSHHLAGKRCILVGSKSDLVRTRVISPSEGLNLAMEQPGVKFTEISAGVGCNIDTLLVGIVLQCRSVKTSVIKYKLSQKRDTKGN